VRKGKKSALAIFFSSIFFLSLSVVTKEKRLGGIPQGKEDEYNSDDLFLSPPSVGLDIHRKEMGQRVPRSLRG
jgi:hypothetical protein